MHIPSAHEVETFTGNYVDISAPTASSINVEDIAHALANTCRYGGHCQRYYSVAEHAVFVARRMQRRSSSAYMQLAGLHHDDAEAYLGDIPRPMKPLLGKTYERMTRRMDKVICIALEFDAIYRPFMDLFHHEDVKAADNWSLFVEARHLLPSEGRHWFNGDQGASTWGLDDQPARIVTPDYWHGGLAPAAAQQLYLQHHSHLIKQVNP
jgi:5'-deoxynucleotidase YfbR-like HD superfamily hydrolase